MTAAGMHAGRWPPERAAAVRLARARDTIARAAALGDLRAHALARRHLDVVEADARACLSQPAPGDNEPHERAASARARAGLARMLDLDPVTRAASTDDLTRAWPAEHLDLLRSYAEHDHLTTPTEQSDAVDRARIAVDAIPPAVADVVAVDDADPDVMLGHHHRDVVTGVQTGTDDVNDELAAFGSYP